MTKDEALTLALEALTWGADYDTSVILQIVAIEAIKEALAQKPVAYLCENAVGHKYFRWKKPSGTYNPIALYK